MKSNRTIVCWGPQHGWITADGIILYLLSIGEDRVELLAEVEAELTEMVQQAQILIPPSGEFASVSVGMFHGCGVKTDGAVICWGNDEYGQSSPPEGTFTSVSAGGLHTCGLLTDSSAVCWGLNEDDEGNITGQASPPGGKFISISAGGGHTCGLKENGNIVCWGMDLFGQASPPF